MLRKLLPRLKSNSSLISARFVSSNCVTSKTDPTALTLEDEGLWYTLPSEDSAVLSFGYNLPRGLRRHHATFGETSLLIRRHGLDLMNCLNISVDSNLPITRYILYGKHGAGKSATLFQALHFAKTKGWINIHVPYITRYSRRAYRNKLESTYKEGRMDQPPEGETWLRNFIALNSQHIDLLQKLELSKDYNWSSRESSNKGDSLMSIINLGLERAVFSCDIMGVLLKELRKYATQGDCKILVAIDQANSMYFLTKVRTIDHGWVEANDLSIIHHLRKMVHSEWCGGSAVLVADNAEFYVKSAGGERAVTEFPKELFKLEALKSLEPFVPIHVDLYNEKEMQSVVQYFNDIGWITIPQAQREDNFKLVKALCARNPKELDKICATA